MNYKRTILFSLKCDLDNPFRRVLSKLLSILYEKSILSRMCNKFVQSRLPNYLASTLCFVSGNGTYGSHTTFRPSIRLGEFLLIGLLYILHLAVPLYPGYHDQAVFNHVQCSTTTRKEYISSF